MLQVIGHTMSYDKYDKFVLNRRDDYFMMKWQLIGVFGKKHEHFIANSDNEDEIRVWADVHGITIEKTIEDYSFGQFINVGNQYGSFGQVINTSNQYD